MQFVSRVKELGWTVSRSADCHIEITKQIKIRDFDDLTKADGEYGELVDMIPLTGGSVWGTECGSVGGYIAFETGRFSINKTGFGGKRFTQAVERLLK